jgi:hypothetical protein
MRGFLMLPFMLLTAPALAQTAFPVNDAQCAATFSALSASARSHAMPSAEFDRMTAIAARRAGSDFAGAQEVRQMSLPDLENRVVNCHARYDRVLDDARLAAN